MTLCRRLWKSLKIHQIVLSVLAKSLTVSISCDSHDLDCWNPCCWSHKILWLDRGAKICKYTMCSKILEHMQVKDMGPIVTRCGMIALLESWYSIPVCLFQSVGKEHWCNDAW